MTVNRVTSPLPQAIKTPNIIRLAGLMIAEIAIGDIHCWWEIINRAYLSKTFNQQASRGLTGASARAVEREISERQNPEVLEWSGALSRTSIVSTSQ
ncbi:hypothetical protein N7326_09035 [Corynebacterium sp. ES2794-CONJ1]|uniref:hypothetical protein n=1 Tax=unclassified Corynebacterium TaxID=2624378 RepID=UPI002169AB4F|nr:MULTISPECIES: hypothetical protein [unclassified Corynebacterium]MCS4490627.1 hypothetical protein [Corynebacterium sp. ES2775-CONJ]MCS4492428.1 hypothetical protein [Corynebacterium sp. ES2715-CONJ3]MCS4532608.1 hypothetical protein [Corynebacterium sp. ES2730-CONJ]MCU9520002.1 hypothetical protein [Corynebacterium sp. ES2794-CONJ1]